MSVFHDMKIEPIKDFEKGAKVYVDGIPIHCKGYTISQHVNDVPYVALDILAMPDILCKAKIIIGNKAEIAKLMDKDEFDNFCEMWHEIHKSGGQP